MPAVTVGLFPDAADLRRIIQTDAVSLAYQPIVDVATGSVVAVEVLARFPDYPSPLYVLRAAESVGLGAEVEALVVRRALAERYRIPDGLLLSINLSPARLLMDPVHSLVVDADLDGIVLELTEHALPPAPEDLVPLIAQVRHQGSLIALDDTGSGYQGIQSVAELRPDWVKIDRSLVTGATHDPVRRASLEMFDRVARRVGAQAVAEGVESEEDLNILRELEIPLAQGFLLGAPSGHVRHLGRHASSPAAASAPAVTR
jgi:EAL domain-containing protein (putative c-di-GMP-specific phosphodiesterase class I)